MFEKEADEWVIDSVCKDCSRYEKCKSKEHCTCKECSKEKWQKGAEFGYNKANEWHEYSERPKEKINALCFDISQNKFILGFYDLEADEWLRYGGYETINIDLWTKIEIPEFIKE